MNDLKEAKKERGKIEKSVMALFIKKEEERQKDFESALTQEHLMDMQFDADALIIFTKLTEWHKKSKNKSQKATIMLLIKALWRLQEYKGTLKTLGKRAISELIQERRDNNQLKMEVNKNKKTILMLEKQVKYYEQGSKKE